MAEASRKTSKERVNLTDTLVKGLAPLESLYTLWDGGGVNSVKGLGVRVTVNGAKSFVWKYTFNGSQRWITIGSTAKWSVAAIRKHITTLGQLIDKGIDPASMIKEEKANPTMDELAKKFLEEHCNKRKPRTKEDYESIINTYIHGPLGKLQVKNITMAHIAKIHAEMEDKPYRANRTLAVLSSMLGLAETWGFRQPGTNPCGAIERYAEKQSTRFLNPEEASRLLDTLEDQEGRYPYQVRLIRLLLLTGARLREILNCRWAKDAGGEDLHPYLDAESARIVCVDHKGSRKQGPKDILLSKAALEVIKSLEPIRFDSPYLFQSANDPNLPMSNPHQAWITLKADKKKKSKERIGIRDLAGLPDLRFHDLRHSFGALSVTLNQNPTIRQKLLGHASAATTERYSHADIDPMRAAVEEIGESIRSRGKKNGLG